MSSFFAIARKVAQGRPPVGTTPCDVVHAENKWRLLRYRPLGAFVQPTPVVLIPSLINRHYVLDLLPHKSFVEYLVSRGLDTYCIDWGTPGDEDRYLDFDDVCDRYVGRAIKVACRLAGTDTAHVLGYCMGGTLAAIHAGAYPDRFASLCALAAPIRFDDDGLLSRWVRSPGFDVDALVDGFGNVPWPIMQASFQLLRPTLGLWKAVKLIDRAWDDRFLDGFFAMETWGNDNVSFPGECYRRYIRELYREDRLLHGTFALGGRPVNLKNVTCPVMAVTFEHDHIVPWQSAAALCDLVGSDDVEHVHLPGGHVGAVVSSAAAAQLWPKMAAFWIERG